MRLAGGRGRGEAWLCVQTRPWASRKQVLAPRAGAASQLQLHSLGVASPGGCGQACQAETRHAPAPLLPSAPGWAAGLGGLLVGERKQRCDYRSRWEALPEKIPTTTHALDRKRGSGRFPDVAADQNQKTREPGGAQPSPRPSPNRNAAWTFFLIVLTQKPRVCPCLQPRALGLSLFWVPGTCCGC